MLVPMYSYLQSRKSTTDGIAFINSTSVIVCSNKRIYGHKVFKDFAKWGKSTKGWFYGFKLHLLCNHLGELISCSITAGNIDDRTPVLNMTDGVFGKVFGDKGYISKSLFEQLIERGLNLVIGIRKNMKNKLLTLFDKVMLRKRAMIESVNNQLKNVFQLEHTRHRSPINGFVNMVSAVIAYTHHTNKPSIGLSKEDVIEIEGLKKLVGA